MTAVWTTPENKDDSDKTPNAVAQLVSQNYSLNASENTREPIHPDLIPLLRSWLFMKQDTNEFKTVAPQPYAKNAQFLKPLILNESVYMSLLEAAKTKDKNFRMKVNLLLNGIRPLVSALDSIFKEAAILPQQNKKTVATQDGDVDITKLRQDMVAGLQITMAVYYQMSCQRKALLRPLVSEQYKNLCGPATRFAEGLLFGEDLQTTEYKQNVANCQQSQETSETQILQAIQSKRHLPTVLCFKKLLSAALEPPTSKTVSTEQQIPKRIQSNQGTRQDFHI